METPPRHHTELDVSDFEELCEELKNNHVLILVAYLYSRFLNKWIKKWVLSAEDDLFLMKEVAAENPFEDGSRWRVIADRMRRVIPKLFTARNLQERISKLLVKFEEHYKEWKTKSGTDETRLERIALLEEIRGLRQDFPTAKGRGTGTNRRNSDEGKAIRLQAACAHVAEIGAFDNFDDMLPEQDEIVASEPSQPRRPSSFSAVPSECPTPSVPRAGTDSSPTRNEPTTSSVPQQVHVTPRPTATPRGTKRKCGMNASVERYINTKQSEEVAARKRGLEIAEREIALKEQFAASMDALKRQQEKEEQTQQDIKMIEMMEEIIKRLK